MPDVKRLYALLVGINEYTEPSVPNLRGCVNDIRYVRTYLDDNLAPGTELRPLVLLDAAATRDAVIEAIRSHLGSAGAEDTALFWFSGHGSEAPVPDRAWFTEPTGMLQTLVCADSRFRGVPDLWDKELSVLLDGVAYRAGHVAVVLDSCHSDGATRALRDREPAARARSVPEAPPRTRESLIAELAARRHVSPVSPVPEHVALAASRPVEAAQEARFDREWRGLFSWALLRALHRLGSSASYRDLLAAAQTDVERRSFQQIPQLRPAASTLIDHAFLNGTAMRPGSRVRMRRVRESWEIDAGAVHGFPTGDGVRVGVRDSHPVREAVVTEVFADRSLVVPADGWAPSIDEQFPVVLTAVPLPRIAVAVDGAADGVASLRDALLAAGPAGKPSLYVHPLAADDPVVEPDLRAGVEAGGVLVITDRHGDRVGHPIPEVPGAGIRRAVDDLEHIARWHLVLDLENTVSSLAGAVRIELVDARDSDTHVPAERGARPRDEDGQYHLRYRRTARGWEAPEFFIRLHNTGHRPLYCVLLDLNSRFRISNGLFPGDFIEPGGRGAAFGGRRIRASLPPGVHPRPRIRVRDRLKLVVAERQFSAHPFRMDPLGTRSPGPVRGALGAAGLVERLGGVTVHRDLVDTGDVASAYDWTTDTVSLITEVPG
jgi:hypothetical protein